MTGTTDIKGSATRRQAMMTGAAALATLALPSAGRAQPRPPAKPRGQVVAGLSQEPTVMHPLMPGSEVDQGVWWALFNPLWHIDPQGNFVPDLAREVPSTANGGLSADGLTWKIRLRTDVKWHDGTAFTADDVKFTLELINNPAFRVRSRVGHNLVTDIKVVAPDEIHWRMTEGYAAYLSILALVFIVPRHVLEKASDPNAAPFAQAPVGTGPFRWGARVAGDHILLHANTQYHGPGPYLERVVFKYVPDLTMLYTQFRTGQVDYFGLGGIGPNFVKEAQALKGRRVSLSPTPFIEHIALNFGFAPFADKAVRQALYLGMNKKARIETLYYDQPIATETFLPLQSWAARRDLPAHVHDPARANALLDAAGWKRGADGVREKHGQRLEFANATTVGNPKREQSQLLLMQDWKALGIAMKITNMPAAVIWGEYWQQSKYQSVMVGANFMLGNDPDVTQRFASTAIPARGGSGLNTYQYQNPEVDALLAKGAREFDQAARKAIYGEIQGIVRDDLVMLPIYQTVMAEGVKDGLTGFAANINVSSNCWNIGVWYWGTES